MIRKNILKIVYSFLLLCFFGIGCSVPFPGDTSGVLLLALLNSNSNSGGGGGTTDPVLSYKFLFVTTTPSGGLLGTVTGADTKCANEKNTNFSSLPGTGTDYKALIVSNVAPVRQACTTAYCTNLAENSSWALLPNQDYYKGSTSSPVKVFTTNSAGIVVFPAPGLLASIDSNGGLQWWTGLNADWTTNGAEICNNWSDGTGGFTGTSGNGNATNTDSISFAFTDPCNTPKRLVCVRQ
ncbi:DUF1554 domain-containing protein [Leptospira yasudae]|uniref:DUF1554 domain-containing protein n=1 Tax=Leptospira yasudae TaxID=2202201 RepID=A0A6N4R2P0_9LEPT|nr:DUF1554 domain-containing protein [Leptospira yasudae]TGL76462.1 DUF1554 domain-containing protein [Leptospira yasudae]TGL83385.1 DUF1554 domain-containing protein [Leptospira yasudae]TGL89467.1 DUF1554 domain-containing protein [Leptospira yasudae]